jgi:hypothetical protein
MASRLINDCKITEPIARLRYGDSLRDDGILLRERWDAPPRQTARIGRTPTIGRPLGSPEWIAMLERRLGRPLEPGKPGPKPPADRGTRLGQRSCREPDRYKVNCHRNRPNDFEREKNAAIKRAVEYAFANCGAKPGELLTDEQKLKLPKLVTEHLMPFLRRHMRSQRGQP